MRKKSVTNVTDVENAKKHTLRGAEQGVSSTKIKPNFFVPFHTGRGGTLSFGERKGARKNGGEKEKRRFTILLQDENAARVP